MKPTRRRRISTRSAWPIADERRAVDGEVARGRPVEAADERQQGRLARTGPSAHGDQLAALDAQVDVGHGVDHVRAVLEVAAQAGREDHRLRVGHRSPRSSGREGGIGRSHVGAGAGGGHGGVGRRRRSWRLRRSLVALAARASTAGRRRRHLGPIRPIRPHADVIVLELEPDPVRQPQRLDMRPRQLQPPRPIQHRVFGADHVMVALARHRPLAQRLAADPPVADGHGPGDLLAHQRVVRGDHDGHAQVAVEPPEELEDLVPGRGVELARRLVGEDDVRPVGEGHGDRDPLLLPARQPVRAEVGTVGQVHLAQQLARPGRAGVVRHAVEDHRQRDVLQRGQVRQQVARRLLPDEADDLAQIARLLGRPELVELVAGDHGPPGRRHVEPAQDVEERALARPRRPDQSDELARLDEQVEALEGDDLEVGDLVDLDQVVAHDERLLAVARPPAARRAVGRRRQVLDLGQVDDLGCAVGHGSSVTIVTYSSPMRMTRPSSSRPTSQTLSAMAAPTTATTAATTAPTDGQSTSRWTIASSPMNSARPRPGSSSTATPSPRRDPDDDGDGDRQPVLDRGQADRLGLGQPERPQEPELARPPLGVEEHDRDDGQRRVDERDRQRQPEASGDTGDERRVVDGRVSVVA